MIESALSAGTQRHPAGVLLPGTAERLLPVLEALVSLSLAGTLVATRDQVAAELGRTDVPEVAGLLNELSRFGLVQRTQSLEARLGQSGAVQHIQGVYVYYVTKAGKLTLRYRDDLASATVSATLDKSRPERLKVLFEDLRTWVLSDEPVSERVGRLREILSVVKDTLEGLELEWLSFSDNAMLLHSRLLEAVADGLDPVERLQHTMAWLEVQAIPFTRSLEECEDAASDFALTVACNTEAAHALASGLQLIGAQSLSADEASVSAYEHTADLLLGRAGRQKQEMRVLVDSILNIFNLYVSMMGEHERRGDEAHAGTVAGQLRSTASFCSNLSLSRASSLAARLWPSIEQPLLSLPACGNVPRQLNPWLEDAPVAVHLPAARRQERNADIAPNRGVDIADMEQVDEAGRAKIARLAAFWERSLSSGSFDLDGLRVSTEEYAALKDALAASAQKDEGVLVAGGLFVRVVRRPNQRAVVEVCDEGLLHHDANAVIIKEGRYSAS